jgi:5'-3' exonuclease
MGIPSYFSNIVKCHKQVIRKLSSLPMVDNLYMDTNGIIYDAVRVIGSNRGMSDDEYETVIINMVCQRITEYVNLIKPKFNVFIAFDGVAPVAKLNQQRERRYKSWFTSIVEQTIDRKVIASSITASSGDIEYNRKKQSKDVNDTIQKAWNTSAITPGTRFMAKLNTRMRDFISSQARRNIIGVDGGSVNSYTPVYIYSGSDVAGEGEHKIFEYIRVHPKYHKDSTTLIYGLDADLIMLCLNHLHISENIYLFRDTPDFIQSLDSNLSKDEQYFLDIPSFACSLEQIMRETKACIVPDAPDASDTGITTSSSSIATKITPDVVAAIDDYIVMTFMLGNDFMPHFPSLNLRTTGMAVLLQTYAHVFRDSSNYLVRRVNGQKTIIWKSMRAFIECLATSEHERFIGEHKLRDRQGKKYGGSGGGHQRDNIGSGRGGRVSHGEQRPVQQTKTDITELTSVACDKITGLVSSNDRSNTMADFMSIPLQERSLEKYIDPFRENWEFRYYDGLFDIDIFDKRAKVDRIKQICVNYIEGLEWTMKYYSNECIDWRWCYKYAYAPLLVDLVRFIPHVDTTILVVRPKNPVRDLVQLCYVLPMASHHLLSPELSERIKREYSHYYCDKLEFKWAYCKYFWEAHTELPHIRIWDLERVVTSL